MSQRKQTLVLKTNLPQLYQNNGTGRDTYISFNSGGYRSPDSRFTRIISDDHVSPIRTSVRRSCEISPKVNIYHSDGTGRDTYITNFYQHKKIHSPDNFTASLRTYDNSPPQKQFVKLSPLIQEKLKKKLKVQKTQDLRLSQSKFRSYSNILQFTKSQKSGISSLPDEFQ